MSQGKYVLRAPPGFIRKPGINVSNHFKKLSETGKRPGSRVTDDFTFYAYLTFRRYFAGVYLHRYPICC